MAEPTSPRDKRIETKLTDIEQSLTVLRREAIESRAVQKRLVDVLRDLHTTNESLRLELNHMRTARERAERFAEFEKAANQGGTDG